MIFTFIKKKLFLYSLPRSSRGFTILELMISMAIFAVLVGFVLTNYHLYSSKALFANATEDVILALRQAQVYGSASKSNSVACGTGTTFECSYGVYFSTAAPYNNGITIFIDSNNNRIYDSGVDSVIASATVQWVNTISIAGLTCGSGVCENNAVSVTFRRPNPDAFITDVPITNTTYPSPYNTTSITITDTNTGKTSVITITRAGQISLQ